MVSQNSTRIKRSEIMQHFWALYITVITKTGPVKQIEWGHRCLERVQCEANDQCSNFSWETEGFLLDSCDF